MRAQFFPPKVKKENMSVTRTVSKEGRKDQTKCSSAVTSPTSADLSRFGGGNLTAKRPCTSSTSGLNSLYEGIGVIPSSLIPPSVRSAVNILHESTQQSIKSLKNISGSGSRLASTNQPIHSIPAAAWTAADEDDFDEDTLEQIMELKRQLARPDLQMTKFSRSLSTGNAATTGVVEFAPGSPYRTSSSGGLSVGNGFVSTKNSLSKELMHKLRSMTETIKMLSNENEMLRRENDRIKDEEEGVYVVKQSKVLGHQNVGNVGVLPEAPIKTAPGDFEQMNRNQLITLTMSYDEKVKKLSEDIKTMQSELIKEKDVKTIAEGKDKYKTLARRLKDERNQFRDTCEEKQKEQEELKNEMEKMSVLISELRVNCQKLQTDLLESRTNLQPVKPRRDTSSVGVQVSLSADRIQTRRASSTSITSESIKKAKSVYGAKQPKPRYHSAAGLNNSSNSSSVSSLRDEKPPASAPARSTRTVSLSPMKRTTPGTVPTLKKPTPTAGARTHQSLRNGGPKFAKPVAKPALTNSSSIVSSNISSPSPRIQSKLPVSKPPAVSKIPAPSSSPLRKTRIPSAPRYNPPTRTPTRTPTIGQRKASPMPKSPSPPPPPPPTQMMEQAISPSPSPTQMMEQVSPPESPRYDEIEDDILCVHPDGQVEIRPSSSSRAPSSVDSSYFQTPSKLPEPSNYQSPNLNNNNQVQNTENRNNNVEESSGCSGGENVSSADDEGSRDGDEDDLRRNYERNQPHLSPSPSKDDTSSNEGTTLKAKKKPERRIQRTWKHFYQELEERKESGSAGLPSPMLSVIEEPIGGSASSKISSPSIVSRDTPSPPPCSRAGSTPAESVQDSSPIETSTETVVEAPVEEFDEDAVNFIQAAIKAHDLRSRTLNSAAGRPKIHTARPWLKKKPSLAPSLSLNEESSEEEMDRVCRSIQGALKSHDVRKSALERLEADKDLFTTGKVSAMKAKFNDRRRGNGSLIERSDGVTDDDDDVVY